MADKPKTENKTAEKEKKEKATKVSAKLQKIIDEVEKLTVIELADLVKALEEKFGVSATAQVAAISTPQVGTSATATAGTAEAVPDKSEFDVVLTATGANKIAVIKVVREIKTELGLKEAKDLVEKAPQKLLEGAKKEEAENAKKKLEDAGAQVELK